MDPGPAQLFPDATFSTQQFVLDADTEYRVLVDWTWTGRHRLGSPTPEKQETQEFRFTTAAAAGPDQQRTILEQDVFDPRALSGYVLAQPALEDPPAFLDDPVRVHFSVGHLTELLDRYHRDFTMEVRRTDVPAAPVTEGGGALNLLFHADFRQKLTDAVDIILADAIFQSACLGGTEPPLGGTEAEIAFVMAPDAGYELRMLAPDRLNPGEPQKQSLFVRAPFRSSRFRNPLELFTALGFGTPGDPGVQYPADQIFPVEFTPSALPARLADDAELSDALHQFGLDALETPPGPRTTLLWTPRPDGSFQVIGLLLEAPEPIERGPRLAVQSVELRSEPLDLVRSTRAGDRLLFAAPAPVAIPPDTESELDIVYTENGGQQQRARRIVLAAPVAVLWEA